MFQGDLELHGLEGLIGWGYHTAAVCSSWNVYRTPQGQWTFRAEARRADPFQLAQRGLEFRTPRKGGYLCWPVMTVSLVGTHLAGTLSPPIC